MNNSKIIRRYAIKYEHQSEFGIEINTYRTSCYSEESMAAVINKFYDNVSDYLYSGANTEEESNQYKHYKIITIELLEEVDA